MKFLHSALALNMVPGTFKNTAIRYQEMVTVTFSVQKKRPAALQQPGARRLFQAPFHLFN